jgi:hypothetical protein
MVFIFLHQLTDVNIESVDFHSKLVGLLFNIILSKFKFIPGLFTFAFVLSFDSLDFPEPFFL